MGDRGKDMGDMRGIRAKMQAKYASDVETEVRGWFKELIGEDIGEGLFNVARSLRSGELLLKLIAEIFKRTANKPEACSRVNVKAHTGNVEFKNIENINKFLTACEAYGMHPSTVFQTLDLYESRNMAQVLTTIYMLGTETRRHNMDGPKIGPNPTESNYRNFTNEQLQQGKSIISLQAGTNKCASQKGMVMGGVRHISDIKITEIDSEAFPTDERKPQSGTEQVAVYQPQNDSEVQGYTNDFGEAEQGGWNEEVTVAENAQGVESEPPPADDDNEATFGGGESNDVEGGVTNWTDGDQGDGAEASFTYGDSQADENQASFSYDQPEDNQATYEYDDNQAEATFGEEESSATINLSM